VAPPDRRIPANDDLRRFRFPRPPRIRAVLAYGRLARPTPRLTVRARRPRFQATPPQDPKEDVAMLTEAEFRALAAAGYNRIPLVLDSFADLDTPLSLYLKLARGPYTFLLESVVGGERFGRYSFIGLPATTRIRATGRRVSVDDATGVIEAHDGDPLAFVGDYLKRFRAAPLPGLPRFCGGLAGYFGYDTVRHIETRLAATAKPPTPGLADVPDLLLLLTEELAVVDNLAGKISLIVYADPAHGGAYAKAVARLDTLRRGCANRLRSPTRRRRRRPRQSANSAPAAFRQR
jgi:anthranilate synthase component 1